MKVYDKSLKLYGFVSSSDSNQYILTPQYSKASNFNDNIARVAYGQGQSQKFYLINKKGKILNKIPYHYIGWANDQSFDSTPFILSRKKSKNKVIAFKKDRKWGLMNEKGKVLLKEQFAAIELTKSSLLRVSHYDTLLKRLVYGAINPLGEVIIPVQYPFLEMSQDSLMFRYSKNCSCHQTKVYEGWINYEGKIIKEDKYLSTKYLHANRYALQDSTLRWAIINEKGDFITPFIFDHLEAFQKGKSIATLKGRKGLIDTEGKTLISFIHKNIQLVKDKWHLLSFPKYELANKEGKIIYTFYADTLRPIAKNTYWFQLNKETGLMFFEENQEAKISFTKEIDEVLEADSQGFIAKKGKFLGKMTWDGRIQIPFQYLSLRKESEQLFKAVSSSQKTVLLNEKGEELTKNYDEWYSLSDGFVKVRKNGLYGFLDSSGILAIPLQFVEAENFKNGFSVVKKKDSSFFGVINKKGEWVISPVVDSIQSLQNQLFFFKDNGEWGVFDKEGIEHFKGSTLDYQVLPNGYVLLKSKNKKGLLNQQGKLWMDAIADSIKFYENDEIQVFIGNESFWLDSKTDSIPTPEHLKNVELGGKFKNGLSPARYKKLWGITDVWGRWHISPRYDSIKHPSEGFTPVKLGKLWGYIDENENIIVQPRYTYVGDFQKLKDSYRAIVGANQKFALISENGRWILPLNYEEIKPNEHGNWLVKQKGVWGIYTNDGLQGIYPKYDSIKDLGNGYVITQKNAKQGFDKINAYSLVFPKYDAVEYNYLDDLFLLITNSEKTEKEF
ncbi:MAG: hypothetical protein OHK0038_06250 [Flammeovirgaceae bacterium]